MDPNAPLTVQQFSKIIWAMLMGFIAPWVVILSAWFLIEHCRDHNASREAQARLQADAAEHPSQSRRVLAREDPDYWARRMELRHQIWQMEQQIREEQLPEEERAWFQRHREEQQVIHREARRRLGLPQEDPDGEGPDR
jgi:hypothetical protein